MKNKKEKPAPDGTVYITGWGERVRIAKTKEHPPHPDDSDWLKEIKKRITYNLVKISDGYSFGVHGDSPEHLIEAYELKPVKK